jgi:hypothetical protein
VPVHADLQTAGQPRGHTHVTQTDFLVHEIEIIVQALAVIGHQVRLAGLLVVPWLVSRAGLHRREDAYQSSMLSAFGQDLFDPVFFPEVSLADELDFQARFSRHLFGVLPNPVSEGFGKLWIVEYPDLPLEQEGRHPLGKADAGQRPEYQHPVPTTQNAFYLSGMSLSDQHHPHSVIIARPVWFRLCRVRV